MMIVDRIEGNIVVIEDNDSFFRADISLFDGKIREGDIIREKEGRYFADKNETEKRRKEIIRLQDSLWD